MKYSKLYDGFLNVFLPLLAGVFIYRAEQYIHIPALIRYYVPDGLWAYAFASCMLIVWERKIHWPWMIGVIKQTTGSFPPALLAVGLCALLGGAAVFLQSGLKPAPQPA